MDILSERGFGKYCGVKSAEYYDNGIMGRFSESGINGDYNGYIRNAWINFDASKPGTARLELLDDDVEIMSDMITIQKKHLGACTTLYKNSLGGRVAVSTYLFPKFLQYNAKRFQLLSIFDWLLEGDLPVKINKDHKITPVIRKNNKDGYLLMMANMSFDRTGNFTTEIKTKKACCKMIKSDGGIEELETNFTDRGISVALENINPWEVIILTNI